MCHSEKTANGTSGLVASSKAKNFRSKCETD